jgi:hypothetical protein
MAEFELREVVVHDPHLLAHDYRVRRLGVIDLSLISTVTQDDGFHPPRDPTGLPDIDQGLSTSATRLSVAQATDSKPLP